MWEKRILALILIAFVLLGVTYAVTTPAFEASDELWHYPLVRHLADGNPLPVQVFDPAAAGPWRQEASQPPLYYYFGAALTFWIDTSDMPEVRRLNPHVDNGVITADGNTNLIAHDPDASPWQGTLLAVRIVRLASVLLGATTVFLTYLIGREVVPGRPEIALGAAAINAFTPMFLFISGAVNNDNLAIPLASLALLLMICQVKAAQRDQARPRRWVLLGLVIGLAVLTKEGTLGLLPLAWGTTFVAAWHDERDARLLRTRLARSGMRSVVLSMMVFLPILLVAGWWYYRNVTLYGDWLGWSAFIAVLGERPQPATLAQLWGERYGFLASYWGLFGGVNVPMPAWIYSVLNLSLVAAVPGFLVFATRRLRDWSRARRQSQTNGVLDDLLSLISSEFGLVVVLLFSAAVVYGLVNWATTTWSSQGRLVFTAISSLSVLLALGLAGWLSRRVASLLLACYGVFLFSIALLAPFLWIAPAYRVPATGPPAGLTPVNADFGGKMRLVGYQLNDGAGLVDLQPGEMVDVTLVWRALASTERDWTVFVHLNDPVLMTPVAQRDMYPGQGLLATRFMAPQQVIANRYVIHVPETAVAPATLELVTGLYDHETNERLLTTMGSDHVTLTTLSLVPKPGTLPNATEVNFGNELLLKGFSIEPRSVLPGETVQLVLYMEALRQLEQDYTIFAQVLNDRDTTRWAAMDRQEPTSSWAAATLQMIALSLTLDEDTPSGVFPIIIGAYTRTADGGFERLQVVREGRITMDDALTLTLIRVGEDDG